LSHQEPIVVGGAAGALTADNPGHFEVRTDRIVIALPAVNGRVLSGT
jgi:hypothetical protein